MEEITPSAMAAYQATAPIYDQLTEHHDYELWLGNMLPALKRRGLRRGRLLDVGCGTGKSLLPMLDRGWKGMGVDISAAMLSCARAKAPGVDLRVADARSLPRYGAFELVWALDDALNYLSSEQELEAALRSMSRNLAPAALCVFDLNTVTAYRGFWSQRAEVVGPPRLLWQGLADPEFADGEFAEAELLVFDNQGRARDRIRHRERHFGEPAVRAAAAAAGLEVLDVYGITEAAVLEQPLDEAHHTKAIYIACGAERR